MEFVIDQVWNIFKNKRFVKINSMFGLFDSRFHDLIVQLKHNITKAC